MTKIKTCIKCQEAKTDFATKNVCRQCHKRANLKAQRTRRQNERAQVARKGKFNCPEHGFLVELLVAGTVQCRCGQMAVAK